MVQLAWVILITGSDMNQPRLLRKNVDGEIMQEQPAEAPKPKAKVTASKSLRDEFAMASLEHASNVYSKMTVAELDRMMARKTYTKDDAVARLAYNMADAMLTAREV